MDTDRAFIWFVYVSLAAAIVLMAVTVLSGDGDGPAGPGDAIEDGNGTADEAPSEPETPDDDADGVGDENRSTSDGDAADGNDTVIQDESDDPASVAVSANESEEDENATREMADVERIEELMIGHIDDLRREEFKPALDSIYMDELWSIAEYHTSQMVTDGFFASETPGGEEYAHRFHRFDPDCNRISNYRQAYEGIARIPYSPWTNSSDHVEPERRIAEQLVANLTAPYGTFTDKRYDDIGVDVQYDEATGSLVTTVAIC